MFRQNSFANGMFLHDTGGNMNIALNCHVEHVEAN